MRPRPVGGTLKALVARGAHIRPSICPHVNPGVVRGGEASAVVVRRRPALLTALAIHRRQRRLVLLPQQDEVAAVRALHLGRDHAVANGAPVLGQEGAPLAGEDAADGDVVG